MRQMNAFVSYLDNVSETLVGRVRFCNLDGTPAEVFGLDNAMHEFISLGSTVYTDSSGRLEPQVFLDNHDYLVIFDKYVGNARMTEDDDLSSWSEQGSAVDKYNTLGIVLEAGAIRSVKTMAELAETEPAAEDEIVVLLGYYEAGDKEPLFYAWKKDSTKPSDGGAVVQLVGGGTGRWELVACPRSLDVRHFGAFPAAGFEVDVVQRYSIQRAMAYASHNNCGIYFHATNSDVYYDITGLTLKNVDCNPWARVFAETGSDNTTINGGIVKVYCASDDNNGDGMGRITLKDKVVRTSWGGDSSKVKFEPSYKLVMDETVNGIEKQWRGIKVEILKPTAHCRFIDCDIDSKQKINVPVVLERCEIKTSWFSDNYDWSNLSSIDNTILLKNCKDAGTYVVLKNKQSEPDYGDLAGGYLANAQILPGNVRISNFSGSIVMDADEYTGLDIADFTGTIVTPVEPPENQSQLYADRCSLVFEGNCNFSAVRMRRCSVYAEVSLKVVGSALFDYCDLSMAMQVHGDLTLKNSTVAGNVMHTTGTSVLNLVMTNNLVAAPYQMGGTLPNTSVHATITGNTGLVDSPINVNRINLDPVDANHVYAYSGNSGTFLPDVTKPVTFTAHVHFVMPFDPIPHDGGARRWLYRGTMGSLAYIWNSTTAFDKVPFFRIGVDRFKVRANVAAWEQIAGKSSDSSTVSVLDALLGAYWEGNGMEWALKPYWDNPDEVDESHLTSKYCHSLFNGLHGVTDPEQTREDYDMELTLVYENLEKH